MSWCVSVGLLAGSAGNVAAVRIGGALGASTVHKNAEATTMTPRTPCGESVDTDLKGACVSLRTRQEKAPRDAPPSCIVDPGGRSSTASADTPDIAPHGKLRSKTRSSEVTKRARREAPPRTRK